MMIDSEITKELIEGVKNEGGSAFQNCRDCTYGIHNTDVIERLKILAELEDKIEQGTLIELPCKVGDIFYYANQLTVGVERHKVTAIEISNETRIRTICSRSTTDTYIGYFSPSYYGKTIFLTREEAEKRLKELQK